MLKLTIFTFFTNSWVHELEAFSLVFTNESLVITWWSISYCVPHARISLLLFESFLPLVIVFNFRERFFFNNFRFALFQYFWFFARRVVTVFFLFFKLSKLVSTKRKVPTLLGDNLLWRIDFSNFVNFNFLFYFALICFKFFFLNFLCHQKIVHDVVLKIIEHCKLVMGRSL